MPPPDAFSPAAQPSFRTFLVSIAASPRAAIRCAAGLVAGCPGWACATPPADPVERAAFEQTNDPLEPLNRQILDFNLFLDRILLKPVTKVYIAVMPEEGRDAMRRALDNMKEPVVFINNVLQGELERAGITVGRFVVNTTLGLGGLVDVAKNGELEKQTGDFGQTLFVWGLPEGPYVMLPLLGPSNPRDAIGMGSTPISTRSAISRPPRASDEMQITRFVARRHRPARPRHRRARELEKNSLDFYAQLRSLSQQQRAAELRHGAAPQPGAEFLRRSRQGRRAGVHTGPPASCRPAG